MSHGLDNALCINVPLCMGNHFVCGLAYADDITSLPSTLKMVKLVMFILMSSMLNSVVLYVILCVCASLHACACFSVYPYVRARVRACLHGNIRCQINVAYISRILSRSDFESSCCRLKST